MSGACYSERKKSQEKDEGDVKKAFYALKMAQIWHVCACFIPEKVNENKKYMHGLSFSNNVSF